MFHKTNIHPSYIDLMAQDLYLDITKARNILKWEPKYNTKESLIDTINFLKGIV